MAKRVDGHELSRRAGSPFLAFALLTWGWAFWTGAATEPPDLYPFLKKAWPGATYVDAGRGRVFEVRRENQVVGYATTGTASGYGGPLTLAVGATPGGTIRDVALLEYRDTPDLLRRSEALLRSLLGRGAGDPFEIGRGVDAVTGATFSSRGIVLAARQAVETIGERGAGVGGGTRVPVQLGPPEIVLLLLLGVGVVGRNRPSLASRTRKLLRAGTLLVSLATLGFLWNRPWTIAFPTRLLAGDWPSGTTHLYWYILLAGVLLAFSRTGRSSWCPWVCPFGAAQDVVGLLGGARRRRLPSALLFTWVKRVLLWLAVLLGLLYRAPAAASYEVFAAFFRLSGTAFQLAILGLVLATAVFFSRPFCVWVCPVDATERVARHVRVWALRLFGRRTGPPRTRRPILLAVEPPVRPPAPVFRRVRNGLLTAAGLLAALLVLGHLHERFSALGRGPQEGLMGRTFVSAGSTGR